jgi:MFS family permease
MYEQNYLQQENQSVAFPQEEYGPRRLTFVSLVLKTFAGLGGGIAGSIIFLLIFLGASSILQPILGTAGFNELRPGEISPLFLVIVLALMLSTTMVSSLVATLFLAYTERERYYRLSTALVQVFIVNLVLFAALVPVYLSTATTNLELTIYAASLQILLSSTASALILELVHDQKYSLLAVYSTVVGVLGAAGLIMLLYHFTANATLLTFTALPIIWSSIGFFQAATTMLYSWIFQTWGSDYLANYTSYGSDYGIPDQSEEEEEKRPDVDGADFLKQ